MGKLQSGSHSVSQEGRSSWGQLVWDLGWGGCYRFLHLGPMPSTRQHVLVTSSPQRYGGGTVSFIPSCFPAPRTEGVGMWGVGTPRSPGLSAVG